MSSPNSIKSSTAKVRSRISPSEMNGTAKPCIIDLFAGVGGLSLGAARAGFTVALAVELDKHAVAAHRKNFPKVEHLAEDIGKLDGETLLRHAGIKIGELD